jgi:GDP-L-fucose synthase
MEPDAKIYVAGHQGLVGSAIVRRLRQAGYGNLVTRSRSQLDLTRQRQVEAFFEQERPAYVFLAAALVGGIWANNTYRADFIYTNLAIETNVIHTCYRYGVDKLLFLGSSCIYPKDCRQPMREEDLLSGYLEPTNEPYAIAKIAGIKMCEAFHHQYGCRFISVMPTNLYGPHDNFDLETSHVLPALIRKAHEAKMADREEMVVWGTGTPRREFLHVDDLADACVFLMNHYEDYRLINIGVGEDVSIRRLAELVCEVVDFKGRLTFDPGKPDGMARKLLDVNRLKTLGWYPKVDLKRGIADTYRWFQEHVTTNDG